MFGFTAESTIEFASQFGQVLFASAAVVIAGYWAAYYAGYKPRPGKQGKPRKQREPRDVPSTPLAVAPSVRALEPWEAAGLHLQGARDCHDTANELAGSAEYMLGRMRDDLEALGMSVPGQQQPRPLTPARPQVPSLAA